MSVKTKEKGEAAVLRRKRIVAAIRAGVTGSLLKERFGITHIAAKKIAEEEGIVIRRGVRCDTIGG